MVDRIAHGFPKAAAMGTPIKVKIRAPYGMVVKAFVQQHEEQWFAGVDFESFRDEHTLVFIGRADLR